MPQQKQNPNVTTANCIQNKNKKKNDPEETKEFRGRKQEGIILFLESSNLW